MIKALTAGDDPMALTDLQFGLGPLRKDHPSWTWKAVREGFGWEYVGTKGARTIRVIARSQLTGVDDEDSRIAWFVKEGDRIERYESFWLREHVEVVHVGGLRR